MLNLQSKTCKYLESQLRLFCRMCWGNNAKSIRALGKDPQELITFEETLLCAKNSALHPSLRSRYVKLMMGKSLFSLIGIVQLTTSSPHLLILLNIKYMYTLLTMQ